jgi:hypothetical protein
MAISPRDLRLLFQQSGNRCAFPTCTKALTFPSTDKDPSVALSEVAHIVGESPDGPRGAHPMPLDERNRYENLILLCEEHHHLVDRQEATYPVEKLLQMKYDHEAVIAEATRRAVAARVGDLPPAPIVRERLFSSLLPVERLPKHIFSVECETTAEDEAKRRLVRTERPQAAPFILRGGRLYCFQNLRDEPGPFEDLARGQAVEREEALAWWADTDRLGWYIALLNRTLNKVTGWRGLNLDRDHGRYYFDPPAPGQPLSVTYRPMNQSKSELQVVWQPVTKKTGKPKNFWYHRAVALQFLRVGPRAWCLAMRPEMRVTRDGSTPLESKRIGGKVTKKKARMFNIDVLEELNFWRAFFFEDRPRLSVPFGDYTALAVSANFLSEDIAWPGVPPERAKSFKNAVVEEGLFDLAEFEQLGGGEAAEDEEWEEALDEA